MRLHVPVLIAATMTATGCASICSRYCQALPTSGTYSVCQASPETHLKAGDQMLIYPYGVVTDVTLASNTNNPVELRMLPGSQGLVAFHALEKRIETRDPMIDHVVAITRVLAPRGVPQCDEKKEIVRIQFLWPHTDGQYRGSTSDPDAGHAHAQLDSVIIIGTRQNR